MAATEEEQYDAIIDLNAEIWQVEAYLVANGVYNADFSGNGPAPCLAVRQIREKTFIGYWDVPGVRQPVAADLTGFTKSALQTAQLTAKKAAYPVYSQTLSIIEPKFDLTRRLLWRIFKSEFQMTPEEIKTHEKAVWDEWQEGKSYTD